LHQYESWGGGSIRQGVVAISKVHDWLNSWGYNDSGEFVGRGFWFNALVFQPYSFVGMLPAAVYTGMSYDYGLLGLNDYVRP
jgi:hypothetical protein